MSVDVGTNTEIGEQGHMVHGAAVNETRQIRGERGMQNVRAQTSRQTNKRTDDE